MDAVNKIISEFAGGLYCKGCSTVWKTTYFETGSLHCDNCIHGKQVLFSDSFDAILPVIKKIAKLKNRVMSYKITCWPHDCYDYDWSFFNYENCEEDRGLSLQRSTAISISQIISELS